jgi:hypothetical protein
MEYEDASVYAAGMRALGISRMSASDVDTVVNDPDASAQKFAFLDGLSGHGQLVVDSCLRAIMIDQLDEDELRAMPRYACHIYCLKALCQLAITVFHSAMINKPLINDLNMISWLLDRNRQEIPSIFPETTGAIDIDIIKWACQLLNQANFNSEVLVDAITHIQRAQKEVRFADKMTIARVGLLATCAFIARRYSRVELDEICYANDILRKKNTNKAALSAKIVDALGDRVFDAESIFTTPPPASVHVVSDV